ncbi:unnamed protein product, partial [marine sediment metagenome]
MFIGVSVVPGISENIGKISNLKDENVFENDDLGPYRAQGAISTYERNAWSETEVVSTESTDDSYFPSLAADQDGNVHVAWLDFTDYGGSGSDTDIFYKYKPSGGSWSDTEVVSTESTDNALYSSLDVDSEGMVHVVWEEYDIPSHYVGVFYKNKPSGGSWTTAEVIPLETPDLHYFYPIIGVDLFGAVHLVWTDNASTGGSG